MILDDPPSPSPARRRWRVLGLVAVVAVVLLALLWGLGLLGKPAAGSCPPPPVPSGSGSVITLVPCNTAVTVGPGAPVIYAAGRWSDHEAFYGAFRSNVTVGAYVVNASQLRALGNSPDSPPSAYFWTCGTVTHCSIGIFVPGSPQSFYLVLQDLHPHPATVTWTEDLVVYAAPQ